jgi:hypothetical protein
MYPLTYYIAQPLLDIGEEFVNIYHFGDRIYHSLTAAGYVLDCLRPLVAWLPVVPDVH